MKIRTIDWRLTSLELALWIIGVTLLSVYFGHRALAEFASQKAILAFEQTHVQTVHAAPAKPEVHSMPTQPESAQTLVAQTSVDLLGVLRIASVNLEVPIYRGTGAGTLRRGAGLIQGTAIPGSQGNVAIAAHRDTFFRSLKDLEIGDLVALESPNGTRDYRVTSLSVVKPTNVHVLDDVGRPVLTLVTCYPFYFVGHAPKRFIVRAVTADAYKQTQE